MNSGSERKKAISIRFCGLGGEGVILASIILGKAAIYDQKNAIQTQSYGAEQRGTKVRGDVIISDTEPIVNPVIEKPDILVAFSQAAFDSYLPTTAADCQLFLNSDLITFPTERDATYRIPALKLAAELNNEKIVNVIMLGALIKKIPLVSKESIIKAISGSVSTSIKELNLQAFQKGYDYI